MTDERGWADIDGHRTPLAEARLPVTDRGFLLGEGVFETLRTLGPRVAFLDRHLNRMLRGAQAIGLPPEAVTAAFADLPEFASHAYDDLGRDVRLRVHVTAGDGVGLDATPERCRIVRVAVPLRPPSPELLSNGVRLAKAEMRKPIHGPTVGVKSLSFLDHLRTRRTAQGRGYGDALFLNVVERVCEATTSNVVAVSRGVLHAPGVTEGALDGVTRAVVLDATKMPIKEQLSPERFGEVDEAFLTNTSGGVVPVREIEGLRFRPEKVPGPVTADLQDAYAQRLKRN